MPISLYFVQSVYLSHHSCSFYVFVVLWLFGRLLFGHRDDKIFSHKLIVIASSISAHKKSFHRNALLWESEGNVYYDNPMSHTYSTV